MDAVERRCLAPSGGVPRCACSGALFPQTACDKGAQGSESLGV
jgi:hypothetical protein